MGRVSALQDKKKKSCFPEQRLAFFLSIASREPVVAANSCDYFSRAVCVDNPCRYLQTTCRKITVLLKDTVEATVRAIVQHLTAFFLLSCVLTCRNYPLLPVAVWWGLGSFLFFLRSL